MSKKIEQFEKGFIKKDMPKFNVGDTVQVYSKIQEEGKSRIQMFEGIVIGKKGRGATKTFTVRRVSYGEGAERTFPINSPNIDKIKVVTKGNVKRAKLYYLRKKIGKKTKIEEKDIFGADTPQALPQATPQAEPKADVPPREEGAK